MLSFFFQLKISVTLRSVGFISKTLFLLWYFPPLLNFTPCLAFFFFFFYPCLKTQSLSELVPPEQAHSLLKLILQTSACVCQAPAPVCSLSSKLNAASYLILYFSVLKLRRFSKEPIFFLKPPITLFDKVHFYSRFVFPIHLTSSLTVYPIRPHSTIKTEIKHFHLDLIISRLPHSPNSHAPTHPTPLCYLSEVASC